MHCSKLVEHWKLKIQFHNWINLKEPSTAGKNPSLLYLSNMIYTSQSICGLLVHRLTTKYLHLQDCDLSISCHRPAKAEGELIWLEKHWTGQTDLSSLHQGPGKDTYGGHENATSNYQHLIFEDYNFTDVFMLTTFSFDLR